MVDALRQPVRRREHRRPARERRAGGWSEIAGLQVTGPHDYLGVPAAGAVMRLRDGRRIPIGRLEHLGGDGRNSDDAVATITERVVTMNALLADATSSATTGR